MKCWLFNFVFLIPFLTDGASGQTIYDSKSFYKPMTDDYDVRYRGSLFLPPCIKALMNCWEVIRPDLLCKYRLFYRQALESMCMDLRLNCLEFLGNQPFNDMRVTPWNYCPDNLDEHYSLNLDPDTRGINNFDNSS